MACLWTDKENCKGLPYLCHNLGVVGLNKVDSTPVRV